MERGCGKGGLWKEGVGVGSCEELWGAVGVLSCHGEEGEGRHGCCQLGRPGLPPLTSRAAVGGRMPLFLCRQPLC